ncbi:MAG TPA: DUF6599 family protein [Terriglobales bacterium]|nr:DUF6599 family protein [Terriglobales bacterium]
MRLHSAPLALLLALGATGTLSAQQWLPEKVGSWTAASTSSSISAVSAALPSDVAEETGFSEEARDYTAGTKKIHVELQKYRDPTSAYEGYTAQLNPGLQTSALAITSAVEKGKYILMLVGNLVLKVEKPTDVSADDIRILVTDVEKYADKSPYPPVRSYMPEDGIVQGSQRYAMGGAGFRNALQASQLGAYSGLTKEAGFEEGAEAMLANYRNGKESGTLIIIEYPTPQLAEQHLHHLEAVLPQSALENGAQVERRTALLSLVLTPSSAAYAENLRKSVNYETEVVWNEPTHSLTDPPWVMVLKTIFTGTFLFCGVAIALGIAFGGFRIVVKRLFPGKVFDRPKNLEVLQLGLSGKPIDPKDFY